MISLGSTQEPLINIKVGPNRDEYVALLDSGATKSALPYRPKSVGNSAATQVISGIAGMTMEVPILSSALVQWGDSVVMHEFLLTPSCDIALVGRDLMGKLGIILQFDPKGCKVLGTGMEQPSAAFLGTLTTEEERKIDIKAWSAPENPGRIQMRPVSVQIAPEAPVVHVKQYPMSKKAREGLVPIIRQLIANGQLEPCQSKYNTPIIAVPKPDGNYRLVQDLREINKIVVPRHPVVPNPYTVLSSIPGNHKWFSVADVKDAFFSVPLAEDSRDLFAFEWEDPETGYKQQLRWTVLPQGYTESPSLFSAALTDVLREFKVDQNIALTQFADDLMLSGENREDVAQATIDLLNFLAQKGLRMSRGKAQLVELQVTYLGYVISEGKRTLHPKRVEAICNYPLPHTKRELRCFIGLINFCRNWIEDFGLKAEPLYKMLHEDQPNILEWTAEGEKAVTRLKQDLVNAPALGLPQASKPFVLFVDSTPGFANAVLCQEFGGTLRPVAYFSKKLDPVAQGWPRCVQQVASTAISVLESRKLTLGGALTVYSPHNVKTILDQRASHWLTPSRLLQFEVILLQDEDLKLEVCNRVNPATFLKEGAKGGEVMHDCLEVLSISTSARPDLADQPLENADCEWFIDGSSRVIDGVRKTGYAVVSLHAVVEAGPLPSTWSAQAAELYALYRALTLGEGKRLTVFTDSKYCFSTIHAYATIWEERGFMTSMGHKVAHETQILKLLDAVWLPKELAVIYVRAHQKETTDMARGNAAADRAAKVAALQDLPTLNALLPAFELPQVPQYDPKEEDEAQQQGAGRNSAGWWISPDEKVWLPRPLSFQLLKKLHEATHWGAVAMGDAFSKQFLVKGIYMDSQRIVKQCLTCLKTNPPRKEPVPPGGRPWAIRPFQYLQIDFAELPRSGRLKYLLVMVDQLTRWPEAFPVAQATSAQVAKCLVEQIIPRHSLPETLDSDRAQHFLGAVVQRVCSMLGIKWSPHCSWHPASGGRVERMNRTLKTQLVKLSMETGLPWPKLLPIALTRIRAAPIRGLGYSPFELLYGLPFSLAPGGIPGEGNVQVGDRMLQKYVTALKSCLSALHRAAAVVQALPYDAPVHPFQPGDWVLIKHWEKRALQPQWKGPFQVLLTTESAVKTVQEGWIHHTRVKSSPAPSDEEEEEAASRSSEETDNWEITEHDGLKLTLRKTH